MSTRTKTGVVTSTKMEKTVTVLVTEHKIHPIYKKAIPTSKKYHAHTQEDIVEGQQVTIQETAPRSKTVKWEVVPTKK